MREFHGNYSCEGMNAAGWGERSSPVPVVVNYRPGQAMIEYYPEVVIKDQPVTLTCNSLDSGRPEASTFRWTRNSHLVPDVTTRDWKIDSASLETKANFTCVPINSEGEGGMASMVINVLARPTFITRLPTYHGALMSADEVSLTCHVECSPNCSIAWLKDNMPLENDTHYSVKNVHLPPDFASGDFESVKSILSWKMEQWPGGKLHREIDNANYTCISTANIAGDGVSSNTIFRVEYSSYFGPS
ncbi:B-cell receptor CD22 [Armadillidium vulgare]|nr:B-cell receptor CD22 [Armadillidium vulgare]